jgi:holo-[acyl-carrier protein] synthase
MVRLGGGVVGVVPVVGVGIDIVDVRRLERSVRRRGEGLARRLFSARELTECALAGKGRARSLAGRWAAKEAVAKALGSGLRHLGWKDIEVTRSSTGQPEARLTGMAAGVAARRGVSEILVSISHEREYAVAVAYAVGTAAPRTAADE